MDGCLRLGTRSLSFDEPILFLFLLARQAESKTSIVIIVNIIRCMFIGRHMYIYIYIPVSLYM